MDNEELGKLIERYEPNEEVLQSLGKVTLIGTVGGSAVGKSTVMRAAIMSGSPPEMKLILSDVSRPQRTGEIDGRDYHFRQKAEMIKGLVDGIYVQAAMGPSGEIYATRIPSYPESGVGTMAIWSYALAIFRRLPFRRMDAAFIVPKSFDAWQGWLQSQSDASSWSEDQLQQRLLEAKQSYEYALGDEKMRFILNDTPAAAGDRLLQVATGEDPDDEAKAREIAEANLGKLNIIN